MTSIDREGVAATLRLAIARLGRRLRQQNLAGLTPSQGSVLATLSRHGPLHMGELARIESIAPPSATGIVGRLEERGLVVRRADPDDARSTVVEATDEARRILDAARHERTALLIRRLARFDDAEVEALAAVLPLLDRLVEDEEERQE